jgi:ATP-dependent Clp protease ATP-binding subunit ClpA
VRRAVGYAQAAGHGHVGTEHLVLGLIDDPDSLASRAIVAQGPTLDEVRAAAEAAMEPSGDASRGHIPFSNDSKKVLQLALREAIRGNDRPIGTEHILLGLLRDESLPGTVILTTCGVTHEATETWIRSEKG